MSITQDVIRRPLIAALVTAALLALATSAHAADTEVPEAPAAKTTETSYSTLQQAIEDRTVKAATLHPREGVAELELSDGRNVKVEYPPTARLVTLEPGRSVDK